MSGASDQHCSQSERAVVHRGMQIGAQELARIQRVVDQHSEWTRDRICQQVCRLFSWYRPNGELADRSCRDLLVRLERRGLLVRLPRSRRAGVVVRTRLPDLSPDVLLGPSAGWDVEAAAKSPLVVRPVVGDERTGWRAYMDRYHYLGCGALVGESLRYVALLGEEAVGLVGWAAAALKNGPRDEYLGWDEPTKLRRLHLVVNNVRFLIFPWIHLPNLATRILAANLRRLSTDWQRTYEHPVLLAETFVDTARFRGTCYRAGNWQYVGQTGGWSRKGLGYENNGHPKGVFLFPLHRHARRWLVESISPADPLPKESMMTLDVDRLALDGAGGLFEVLGSLLDPRKPRGKRHSLTAILAIAACATLCGARSLVAMGQWAAELSPGILKRLGCKRARPPCESTIRRTLAKVDVAEMDKKVGAWMIQQTPLLGRGVAMDGKTLRGAKNGDNRPPHLVSAVVHETGEVVAQTRVADKTNEIKSVEPLFQDIDIRGAVVTGDAMFTQVAIAKHLVEEKGADYLFTVKDNQPTLRKDIEDLGLTALSPPEHHVRQGPRPDRGATDLGER